MNLSKILETIKKKLERLSLKPEGSYLDFGDFILPIVSFSYADESRLRYNLGGYGRRDYGGTCKVRCSFEEEKVKMMRDRMYDLSVQNITLMPSNMVMLNAFVRSVRYSDISNFGEIFADIEIAYHEIKVF